MINKLEIAYVFDVLERLTQSADGYIDDGSWLEPLTDDIKEAKRLLKNRNKLQEKEIA